jgi:DNA-binding transcriptional ArsR family regulator
MFIKYDGEEEEEKLSKDLAKESVLDILSKNKEMSRTELIEKTSDVSKIGSRNIENAIKELETEEKIKAERKDKKKYYSIAE